MSYLQLAQAVGALAISNEALRLAAVDAVDRSDEAVTEAQQAATEAAATAASVASLNKVNKQYPFTFATGQAQYDVGVISGDSTVTTASMALITGGLLDYAFTINDAKKFTLNSPGSYTSGAAMRIVVNARFDDLIQNFDDLQDVFTAQNAANYQVEKTARTTDYYTYLGGLALEMAVPYAPGIAVIRSTQTVTQSDVLYRPRAEVLPFETSEWVTDVTRFVVANDMALRQDLADDTDPAKGAAQSGWDGSTVGAQMDLSKKLADYAALRAYTGSASVVLIPSMGDTSAVVRDDSVTGDDNLTKFIDGSDRQWRRLQLTLTLEQCGISSTNTPVANAALLTAAILGGVRVSGGRAAYSFDFAAAVITYSGSVLQMDLGPYLHTFTNWGGIVANNIAVLEYNGRIDAGGGYCKGLGRFRNLLRAKIGTIEFQNVFCVNPDVTAQFFGVEYSSDTYGDNPLVIDIDTICIKNVITQTYTQGTGNAIPMTVFGNYGSSSSQVKQHQLNIGNFHVEEYYSVSQDGVTPIDGDSDVMRLFTNPTQVNIGTIYAKNVAKRFFKTQEAALVSCQNVYWANDARFPAAVFSGFFEGQAANSGVPTHFEIGVCEAYYPSADVALPPLFNASGLGHSISISTLHYKNIGFYSANQNVGISIGAATGDCLSILAAQSKNTIIRRLSDTGIRVISVSKGVIENFDITFGASITTTGFILAGVHLKRGNFLGWKTSTRVAQFYTMEDVTLQYTNGDSYIRAFQPITGGLRRVTGFTVTDTTLLATQLIEGPGGTGTLVARNFRGTGGVNLGLGFISTGTWEVRLDDCNPATFTGAGATVKTVSYV